MLLSDQPDAWRSAAEAEGGRGRAGSFFKAIDVTSLPTSWAGVDGSELSAAYLQTIRSQSLVDAVGAAATHVPERVGRVLVAIGASANTAVEGSPKAVTALDLSTLDADPVKTAAILVMSAELARAVGSDLFSRELQAAVIQAGNAALAAQVSTTSVSSTGSALGDLKAGLAAAGDASAYVVGAVPEMVRELAFASDNQMGIDGGDFLPGVTVVRVVADSSTPGMTIYPASGYLIADSGLVVRNSSQASVEMSGSPTDPTASTVMTSLWQNNLLGILLERRFRIFGDAVAVEVG